MLQKQSTMRYLDPKNNFILKKLFGQHPDLLISLLNALMPLDEGQIIEKVEYLPEDMVIEIPEFNFPTLCARCLDNRNLYFVVQIHMLWTPAFKYRIRFNSSTAHIKQLDKGNKYDSLQPVYALNLVNDIFIENDEDFYHHYSIVNVEKPERKLEGLEFVFIELPKFQPQNMDQKKMAVLWLRFLTEIKDGNHEVDEELFTQDEIRRALEMLNESAFTESELAAYDRYWDAVSKEKTYASEKARMAREEGREEGLEEGIEIGRQEGLEEGIEKGREEGLEEGIE
ncbi:MAG: hypothetical protein F6K17_30500, partial [Okeania sp. SIO3C4]|nr:hypothetical protein [Okeania sp. SIO3C4]